MHAKASSTGTARPLFIRYALTDSHFALQLAQSLRAAGVTSWIYTHPISVHQGDGVGASTTDPNAPTSLDANVEAQILEQLKALRYVN